MRTYRAKSSSRSVAMTLRSMFGGLRLKNYVGYRLFAKDIRADYSRTLGGMLWDFVEPLAFVMVFVYLKRSQTLVIQDMVMPYTLYVAVGMLLWQIFNESIKLPLAAMQRAKPILKNMNVAPESLIFSTAYRIVFNAFFGVVVMFGFCLAYDFYSPRGMALFLLMLPALMVTGLSIGFLLAPFNVIYNDVGKLVNIILRPLMFVSGTIFPISKSGSFALLHTCNPALVMIDGLRTTLTIGTLPSAKVFAAFTIGHLALFLVAWYLFHVAFRMVSDKL